MSDKTPFLAGYTVKWDNVRGEWVATRPERGIVLRGKDERELETARNALVAQLVGDFDDIFRTATWHGYPPPP